MWGAAFGGGTVGFGGDQLQSGLGWWAKQAKKGLAVVGRKAEHPVRNALILSGVLLSATAAVIVLGPQDHVMQEVVALLAGLAVGVWLLRFSPLWRWLAMLVLVLVLVLCLVLGPAGIAWFGGFISGTQAGLAWQHAS